MTQLRTPWAGSDMAIDVEIKQRAEELFIIEGLTIQAVAEQLGISERTIANWSSDGEWVARRREYRNAARDIRYYGKMTRLKLIKDAMTSLDPQKIYAFAALERMEKTESLDSPVKPENDVLADIEIKTPQEAVQALQEAIELKLRVMLAQPDALNFGAIKDLKQAMALVDEMKAKYCDAEEEIERIEGNDEEQARFWREKFLKGR